MTVSTNLTGLYANPSWQSPLRTQLFYGWKLEVLEQNQDWAHVRMLDGFQGWAYLPYLTAHPAPDPTHMVIAPASYVRAECSLPSPVVGRILCGTAVQVVRWIGSCAEIDAQVWGWVTAADLRALEDLPKSTSSRRSTLVSDATRLTGVPYVQGGCTAMGIDDAGFTHLLHRLIGLRIPREVEAQFAAGRKVEFPFQPGDLLFFGSGDSTSANHVAVSLGEWRILHSSLNRNGVYLDDIQHVPQLKENFLGACSFL